MIGQDDRYVPPLPDRRADLIGALLAEGVMVYDVPDAAPTERGS